MGARSVHWASVSEHNRSGIADQGADIGSLLQLTAT